MDKKTPFKSSVGLLIIVILLLTLFLITCTKSNSRLIDFKNRQIDLKPYVEGFPYRGFTPFYDAEKMYYYKVGDKTQLLAVSMSDTLIDLSSGRIV